MINKKLTTIIILTLMTLISTTAYNQEIIIEVDSLELPKFGSELMQLSLENNYTLYLQQHETSPYINLTFPETYYYNGTDVSNFSLLWGVEDFFMTNDTQINVSLNLTSDHPNFANDYKLGLIFNVTYSGQEALIQDNNTYYFYFNSSKYYVNISKNLLPNQGEFNFKINGLQGSTAKVTYCEDWLICPDNITFTQGEMVLSIGYNLSYEIQPGTYEKTFDIKMGDTLKSGTITFQILEEDFIFKEWVWQSYCYDESGFIIDECWQEYMLFREQQMIEVLKRGKNNSKEIQVIINETEKLVMTGSVDEELKNLYDGCKQNYEAIKTGKEEIEQEYTICSADLSSTKKLIEEKEQETLRRLEEMNSSVKMREKQAKNRVRNWFISGFLLVFLLVSGFSYNRYHKKLNGENVWGS